MRILSSSALVFWLLAALANAQSVPDEPAYASLAKAFEQLQSRDYDSAIASFQAAAAISPKRADIRKNLAYTYLKTGDSDEAREQFAAAMEIDPVDFHVALEYAFLCFEARDDAPARKAEARRIFARIQTAGDPESKATAALAFQNIDAPLAAGIARWQKVLVASPATFSAHYELAQLAEQRDELDLAAGNYRAAFRLLPERKSVLLDLARVEKARGNPEGMMAALLAASRGSEPRAAEAAREKLPRRYPFVYEFRNALEVDPAGSGGALRRELAYLLLQMSNGEAALRAQAEREFAGLIAAAPTDYVAAAQLGMLYLADKREDLAMPLLNNVLAHGGEEVANRVRMALQRPLVLEERRRGEGATDPRVLGERSYQSGFLKDALRYFTAARENDPVDASIALKLGWTNNMLHDDAAAIHWFDLARQSADPAVAKDAARAYDSLRPGQQRLVTTVWLAPLVSSRWKDLFGYGQLRTELRLKELPFRPYVSLRYTGDARRSTGGFNPQSLSESAFIVGGGIVTPAWRRITAWFEAGAAASYLNGARWRDVRGGLTWARTWGASIAGERPGWFLESTADSVFIGHFNNDLLNYSQNRTGYTFAVRGIKSQAFWHQNVTFDVKRQYWANFVETGPGYRIHPPGLPPSFSLTVSAIHGVYLRNEGNPRRPGFNDVRLAIWYAVSK